MQNRRSMFALIGAAGAATVLPSAAPVAVAQPADPWDTFLAGLEVMSPVLAEKAARARARGYALTDCRMIVFAQEAPEKSMLMFGEDFLPASLVSPGSR